MLRNVIRIIHVVSDDNVDNDADVGKMDDDSIPDDDDNKDDKCGRR